MSLVFTSKNFSLLFLNYYVFLLHSRVQKNKTKKCLTQLVLIFSSGQKDIADKQNVSNAIMSRVATLYTINTCQFHLGKRGVWLFTAVFSVRIL